MDRLEGAPPATVGQKRLILLARLAALWALVISARLVSLQVFTPDDYKQWAESQHKLEQEVQAMRGEILDSRGHRLAMSVQLDSIAVNPRALADPAESARVLARALHLDEQSLLARIERFRAKRKAFMWVKRAIPLEEGEALRSLDVNWIDWRREGKRVYPNGTLAANLLGGVDKDQTGIAGIEAGLNKDLSGRNGQMLLFTTGETNRRELDAEVIKQSVPGYTVALTLDSRLQYVADQAISDAVVRTRSTSGSAVIMDPHTGHVLAMSSYPTFDPNKPLASMAEMANRVNQATSVPFEPGSIFKTFSWATAFEVTRLKPADAFNGGGGLINVFGQVIHDHHRYGALTMGDGLVLSSNVVAAQVGLASGSKNLFDYLTQRFGFGARTGLPVPNESSGMVRKLNHWNKGSVAYVAMGHEIGATTIQLAQAASVIANGGFFVKPQLVLWKKRPNEQPVYAKASEPRQVLKPETAILMRALMEQVVLRGTGKNARLEGYTSGGKTGSAQIFDLQTRRYTHMYNASFLGMVPAINPNVVVVVTLNGAREFGGVLAAPVFREIAEAAMRIRRVARDIPDTETPQPPQDDPRRILADASDAPPVADQEVAAALRADARNASNGVVVGQPLPDFAGMTLSDVLRECVQRGLELDPVGSGLARRQVPAPGQLMAGGGRVRVTFAQ